MTSPDGVLDATIAIACYSQAAYLAEAIESALAQGAAEVIVVDDGSTDGSATVARSFAGVTYHHQANAGLSAARNTGLALARTSTILFLDADDRLRPGTLAAATARLRAVPGAAFVYGGYRDIAADGAPISEHPPVTKPASFAALLHDNYIGMHGTVLYDTSALRAIGGFDTSLTSCEDWDAYLRLARHHPIASYPLIAADYRRHPHGMSRNLARMAAMTERVLAKQAGGLSAGEAAALRAGRDFARRQRSLALIGAMRATPGRALALAWLGWRHDARFPLRLAHAALRRLG